MERAAVVVSYHGFPRWMAHDAWSVVAAPDSSFSSLPDQEVVAMARLRHISEILAELAKSPGPIAEAVKKVTKP